MKDLLLVCFGIHLATWLTGCSPSGGGASSVTVNKIVPPPVLKLGTVTPSNGPLAGGTTITITGENLVGDLSVTVGGLAATSVTPNIARTQITCVTAASPTGGAKEIRVTSTVSGTAALISAFTYQDAPTVSSFGPASAPQDQNTPFTVQGTGFVGDVTVTVGDVPATTVVVSGGGTQVTCVIQASATAGAKNVVVTSSVNGSVTLLGGFTHRPSMTITSISPSQGILAGNDLVTISGANLLNITSVTFGASPATITQQTGTGVAIQVLSPAASTTGTVSVTLVSSTNGTLVSPISYTYTLQYTANGRILYEDIPVQLGAPPLQVTAPQTKPARLVTVEVIRTDRVPFTVLGTGKTDLNGNFSVPFTKPGAPTPIQIRAIAQLSSTVSPTMDFQVADNTGTNVPTYALLHPTIIPISDSQATLTFPTLLADDTSRINGPFSILDSILVGVQAIRTAAPSTSFPQLFVFWSKNNTPVDGNIAAGNVGTSFYTSQNGVNPILILLGDRAVDSDEFDKGVVMHEFGHYLEDQFGRSDSLGGPHGPGDILDFRLAFGEGFGNAISSMLRNDPFYIDTAGPGGNAIGNFFDMEDNEATSPQFGYYSEASVGALLFDLFDSNADTCPSCTGRTDNVAMGLGPIFAALADTATISKLTSLHEFIRLLKDRNPADVVTINEVAEMEGIATTIAATTALNNPAELAEADVTTAAVPGDPGCYGGAVGGLPYSPIYRTVVADTNLVDNVVSHACQSIGGGVPDNRLFGFAHYLVTSAAGTLNIATTGSTGDIDLFLVKDGQEITRRETVGLGDETINLPVAAGTYVLTAKCLDTTNDVTYTIDFNLP